MSKKSTSPSAPNPGWFPRGRSGNLDGRPRVSRASKGSAFEVLVEKTLTVADGGGTREITVEEALQQRTFQDALAGKRMAMREVVKWIIKREKWLAKHAHPKARPAMRPFLASPDPDNADAALMLLGIAAPNPARADWKSDRTHLLLEPWAVQAALRRRRGGQCLTDGEHDDIRRCTRDSDSLRWPREIG
jgi:Family of unknown function (DUF5681)